MNSRYYQPSTGRFLSQDTYSGNAYDPWTQHLYSYCGNNPVNMVDPTGHSGVWAGILAGIWGAAFAEPTPFGEVVAGVATAAAVVLGAVSLKEITETVSSSLKKSSSTSTATSTQFMGPNTYVSKPFSIDWGDTTNDVIGGDGTIAVSSAWR